MELHTYLGLLKEHPKEIGALLPKSTARDVERLASAIEAHGDRVKDARSAGQSVTRRRTKILSELRTLSADVRALAAILFRNKPELARQFQLPKRRASRARASRAAPPPPLPSPT